MKYLRILLCVLLLALPVVVALSGTSPPAVDAFQSSTKTLQNAAVANGPGVALDVADFAGVAVTITGTFVATVNFEASMDGFVTMTTAVYGTNYADQTQTAAPTVPGSWYVPCAGQTQIRARISGYVSGSVTVTARPSAYVLAKKGGGTGAITSVFGRTGVVIATANDYTFAQLASTPTTLAGYGITNGANTALSNLAAVSINAGLVPQTTLDLGAAATAWRNLYLYGQGTYGSTSIKLDGTPTGNRTVTFADANLTFSGAFNTTITSTATTNSTLPAGTHSLAPLDSPAFVTPALGTPVTVVAPTTVEAQAATAITNWYSNLQTADGNLISASENILQLNHQFVANGWSSSTFTAIVPAGVAGTDVTTALTNLANVATGIVGNGAVTVASGTSTTIYKIRP